MTWTNGRQLTRVRGDSSFEVNYTYDGDGLRTGKSGTRNTEYIILGGTYIGERTTINGTEYLITYIYDANGSILGIDINGTAYYFVKNLQGDVTAMITEFGEIIGKYTYDAYGYCYPVKDASGNTITDETHPAMLNPFRYRGYYYDVETKFYYLNTRYYDPEACRFINADGILSSYHINGLNLFAYCYNNPVNMVDNSGKLPEWLWGLGAAAVAEPSPFLDIVFWGAVAIFALTTIPTVESQAPSITIPVIIIIDETDVSVPPPNKDEDSKPSKSKTTFSPVPTTRYRKDNDTLVYRYSRGRNKDPREYKNLTPRPNRDFDGLSFMLNPSNDRGYAVTTLGALRSLGFICTVNGNHVSVMPAGGVVALYDWMASYNDANENPHELTLLIYSITY